MEEYKSANVMFLETEKELSNGRADDDFKEPEQKELADDSFSTEPVHAD